MSFKALFRENSPERSEPNVYVLFFNEESVDKLHFRGHKDAYCQKFCDPWKIKELDGVNTPVCEQTFAWMNRYNQCRNMNEPR